MHKVKKVRDNYLAEIIVILVIATMLLTSCGSTYNCPAYSNYKTNTNVVG